MRFTHGQIKTLQIGNTELVAGMIQKLTGGELFKIKQEQPYAKEYNECIEQAHTDQNTRSVLKCYQESIDEYDVIYLRYPNYWSTMPMAVFTFLEHFNFDGKIIKPFCTHEGSGMGNSVRDIQKLCPNATVEKGLAICGGTADRA